MKKILLVFVIILALTFVLAACKEKPSNSSTQSNTTTSTQLNTTTSTPENDVVEIIDGYIWVNGINTGIKAECDHIWEIFTTAPTCSAGGYDTMTCKLCEKSVVVNESAPVDHEYNITYTVDETHHWLGCANCDAITDKVSHSPEDGFCKICKVLVPPTQGVIYDVSADGTYAEVIGYEGTSTTVIIADEYKGLPIKTIYDNAFENTKIVEVIMPDSVTIIGDYAFENCQSLTSIKISPNVVSIGYSAFSYCNNLKYSIYDNCKYLASKDNLYFALIETTNKNHSSYEIHNDAKVIADNAFYDCTRLLSITIPNGIRGIGRYAFNNCDALISVVIPDSVTYMGDRAFEYCENLESVVVGNGITNIDVATFNGCPKLTRVILGKNIVNIASVAFDNGGKLKDIYFLGSEEEWNQIVIQENNWSLTNVTIHYNYVPEE